MAGAERTDSKKRTQHLTLLLQKPHRAKTCNRNCKGRLTSRLHVRNRRGLCVLQCVTDMTRWSYLVTLTLGASYASFP